MTIEISSTLSEEQLATAATIRAYAFRGSPQQPEDSGPTDARRVYAALEAGSPVATAAVIPMHQNVRGTVLPMAGIAGVATHPAARRQGHIRALLPQVLTEARDAGAVVSCLYPFRASFYERFGYTTFPRAVRASFSPRDLAGLTRTVDDTGVSVHLAAEVTSEVRTFLDEYLRQAHGFTQRDTPPEPSESWVALARRDNRVVGVLRYTISGYHGTLSATMFLASDTHARAMLLAWLARHVDQIERVDVPLPPASHPELWWTDLAVTVESRVGYPYAPPPMGRILAPELLSGLSCGTGSLTVEVTDEVTGGVFALSTEDGRLAVTPGSAAQATLTSHGLAALVFGVADPAELVLRGHATADAAAQATLRSIFPPATPYLFDEF